MEKIIETDYYLIEKDITQSLYRYTAKRSTENLTDELFFKEGNQILKEYLDSKCEYAIANDKDFRYVIHPKIQEIFNKTIIERLNNSIIKKFAHIIPTELISELSTDQLFDENTKRTYKEQLFPSLEEAEKWIFDQK